MNHTATYLSHGDAELENLLIFLDLFQYYSELIEDLEIQTAPLELHDRKQRRQMVTLLTRPDSLFVLLLIYAHSSTSWKNWQANSNKCMGELGERITPANISRLLWKHSNLRDRTIEPTRAQRVQAGRIVEASLHFKLTEPTPAANRKEKPIKASGRLVNLVEQLTDFSGMKFSRSIALQDSDHPLADFINRNRPQLVS